MNCETWQQKILLAQSGELSGRESRALEEHLAACPSCRAYSESLKRLTSAAREPSGIEMPGAAAMAQIRRAAEQRAGSRLLAFPAPAIRALALAAAVAAVVAGWMLLPSNHQSQRIEEIHTIMAMVSEDDAGETAGPGQDETRADLRALARQLLVLEGLAVEDFSNGDLMETDAEPQPTAFQWRSTREPWLRRCV